MTGPPPSCSPEGRLSIAQATAHAACTTAADVGADAILTVSQSGLTARLVSHFHPETPIIACLLSEEVRRQMALSWGVTPLLMPRAANTDELIQLAVQAAEQAGLVRTGDLVVVTAGVPTGVSRTTHLIKVHVVGGALLNAVGSGQGRSSAPAMCWCCPTPPTPSCRSCGRRPPSSLRSPAPTATPPPWA